MEVKHIAFAAVTATALATAASAALAATSVTTIATIAYGILSVGSAGISMACVAAWVDPSSEDRSTYFANVEKYSLAAVAGIFELFSQVMVQALINGAANGVSRLIENKIAGHPTVVVR